MSILDDAIREHLELKRAHGADAAELKKLEDEAFGPPQRPDDVSPFAEAPTEFLGAPELGSEAETTIEETGGRRVPNIADLQEAPPPPEAPEAEAPAPETGAPAAEAETPLPEAAVPMPEAETPAPEAEAPAAPEPPAIEEQPAIEQPLPEPTAEAHPEPEPTAEAHPEPEPEPPAAAGHSTEERHAIAEQPTQFFDVEAEMEEPAPPAEAPSPTDEQLADAEASEPRLAATPPPAPVEPMTPTPEPEVADEAPSEEYEEDDFFSEQRLSEELDQALEAPVTEEHAVAEEPISEEYEEGEYETGEEEHEPPSEEHEHPAAQHGAGEEDVLEAKPDFLEDEEDDDLWFEQRPPKDFDFDD